MTRWMGYLLSLGAAAACGPVNAPESYGQLTQALIGGLPVGPHEHLAVGALLTQNRDGSVGQGLCTATLIAPNLVLTAAHCAPDDPSDALLFTRQRNVRLNLGKKPPRDAAAIESFLAHEDLRDEGFSLVHDVAVGRLARPVTDVPPYELLAAQEAGWVDRGTPLELVGFGYFHYLSYGDSSAFRGVKARGVAPARSLDADFLVVGDETGLSGCYGDSGGPALLHTSQGPRIAGVVSTQDLDRWGGAPKACTGATVYTSVPGHADWIAAAAKRALGPS